jgi:transporter family protein
MQRGYWLNFDMALAYLALLGRVILLGYERIVVKQLGQRSNSEGAAFLFFAIAALFLLPFLLLADMPSNYGFLPLVVLGSFAYAVAFALYVKSLSLGEVSLVSPLYNFNVLFLLILTAILLGEPITAFKIVGVLLLIFGASLLNRQKNLLRSLGALFKDRACLLMILCSILMAIGRTIDGFVVQEVSPMLYAFSIYTGISLFLLVYLLLTKKTGEMLLLLRSRTRVAVAAGAVNAYSYVLLLFAFTKIAVSVAEPVSMLGMIATVILARLMFKERIGRRLVAVIVMIAGAWFLLYA